MTNKLRYAGSPYKNIRPAPRATPQRPVDPLEAMLIDELKMNAAAMQKLEMARRILVGKINQLRAGETP